MYKKTRYKITFQQTAKAFNKEFHTLYMLLLLKEQDMNLYQNIQGVVIELSQQA